MATVFQLTRLILMRVLQVVAALDRAALSGARYRTSVSLMAMELGRLKSVLREYLKDSPYVENFRPDDRAEGGDGGDHREIAVSIFVRFLILQPVAFFKIF